MIVDDLDDLECECFEFVVRLNGLFDVFFFVLKVEVVIFRFDNFIFKFIFLVLLLFLCFNIVGVCVLGIWELRGVFLFNIFDKLVVEVFGFNFLLDFWGEGGIMVEDMVGEVGEVGIVGKLGVEFDVLVFVLERWCVVGVR